MSEELLFEKGNVLVRRAVAEGVVIHHVKGNMFPNEVGGDNIRYYEFSGDRLTLTPTNIVDGKLIPKSSAAARLIWERVKP